MNPSGYGAGNFLTTVGFGPDSTRKFITTYFRTTMTVARSGSQKYYGSGLLLCDDGCVVYWNGYVGVLTAGG